MSSDENRPPDSTPPAIPATNVTEPAIPQRPTVPDLGPRTEVDLDATQVGRPPTAARPTVSAETPLDDAATVMAPRNWAPPGRDPRSGAMTPPAPPAALPPPPPPPPAPPTSWPPAQPATPPPWPGTVGPGQGPSGYPGQPPQGQQSYPGAGYLPPGYPGQGHEGQGYQRPSYPGQGYPGQGQPGQGQPGQGYPGQGQPPQGQAPASQAIPAYPGTPAPIAAGLPGTEGSPLGMSPGAEGGTGAIPAVTPAPGPVLVPAPVPSQKRSGLTIALLLVTILLGISVLGTGGWWVTTAGSKNSEITKLKGDHQAYLKQKKEAEDAETARFTAADLSGKLNTVRRNNDALTASYEKMGSNWATKPQAEQTKIIYSIQEATAVCTESIIDYNQTAASFPLDKLGSLPTQVDMNDTRYFCRMRDWHA